MSRKLIIVFGAIVGGCGGGGGSAPVLSAEELREGPVGATLDVLLGAIDVLVTGAAPDAHVRGEPVTLLVTVEDGVATVEAIGLCRTEATLRLADDPEGGVSVTGTIVTESPDGTVVEGTLERVFVRIVADLPGVGAGALFTSGNVDLGVYAGDAVVATGTAALFGRGAVVGLSMNGHFTEGEIQVNS
jgi:hypothetical protein